MVWVLRSWCCDASTLCSCIYTTTTTEAIILVESGYLAHAPDESTIATCALENGIHGYTTDPPSFMMSLDFDLGLTELC